MTVGPHSTKLPQPWDTRSDQPGVPFRTERSLRKKVFLWSECQQFEGQWLRGVRCFAAMTVDVDQPGVPACTERSLPKKVFLWSECQQFEGQWLRGVRCFEAMKVDVQHMLVSFISCFPVHVGEIHVILFARLVI